MRVDQYLLEKNSYWTKVFSSHFSSEFLSLTEIAKKNSQALGKDGISISITEAFAVHQSIKKINAKQFIELGSLTGYSALFILHALSEGGKLYCFEKDPKLVTLLESVLTEALQLPEMRSKSFQILTGDAIVNLSSFQESSQISGIFIDANKSAYLNYLNWTLENLNSGSLVIADNIYLNGAIWGVQDHPYSKKQIQVMNDFNKIIFDPKLFFSELIDTSEGLVVAKKY